jgi:uncharacterized phage protein (TIGR01671 family)
MARPIEFRAWDKTRHEFLSGGEVLLGIGPGKNPKNTLYLDLRNNPNVYRDRFELMQFTGLLDRRGVKIWEGDIVALDYEGIGTHVREIGQVFWHGQGWDISPQMRNNSAGSLGGAWQKNIEVIGNIYESPSLLEANP